MAFSCGFYNSKSGDRKYNAVQISHIFDGIVLDGVLMSIGNRFVVKADGGLGLKVGSGRGWFKHTWSYNDSDMPVTARSADILYDRIDALVLEVDARDESRLNAIRWIYGEPATMAERPVLIDEPMHTQYPLAYVEVPRGTTEILQSHITNMIGTSVMPYATGALEGINADDLLMQWDDQWKRLLASMQLERQEQQTTWTTQTADQQTQWQEQTDRQQTDWAENFQTQQAIWGAWIGAAIADPANYFQRNFDNPAMYIGSTRWRTKVDSNTTLDEIRAGQSASGVLAASRRTTKRRDGADVVYTFYDIQNGSVITRFTERFDKVNAKTVRNYIEGVV